MGFEAPNNAEKEPPRMTKEEFDRVRNTFGDDMKSENFKNELARLGIELDSGPADIVVDGERMKIVTDRNDFGTVIEEAE